MSHYEDYEDEYENWRDQYGEAGFQKTPKTKKMKKEEKRKNKDKHARTLSQEELWNFIMPIDDSSDTKSKSFNKREEYTTLADASRDAESSRQSRQSAPINQDQVPSGERKFVPGPNTQTIRNYQIDFDRVYAITKLEGEYKGKKNFGVKFEFKGTKGLFRIIWFYSETDRDALYEEKYAFWTSLETCPLNRNKGGKKPWQNI
jgi:hypothetical protein